MFNKILILILVLFIFSCTDIPEDTNYILNGTISIESLYSNNTYITRETVDETFKNNTYDFWFFAIDETDSTKDRLKKDIYSIEKKRYSNKNTFFSTFPLINVNSSNINLTELGQGIIYNIDNDINSINFTDAFQNPNSSFLYNVFSVDYQDKISDHLSDYISLLDKGYILGLSINNEIIGPEWNTNEPVKMYAVSKSKNIKAIHNALSKRNTYISLQEDVDIKFTIDNIMFGGVIEKTKDTYPYSINITSKKDQQIEKVELISNNSVIIKSFNNINSSSFTSQSRIALNDTNCYVYLKVYYKNGTFSQTSPIWKISTNNEFSLINYSIADINENNEDIKANFRLNFTLKNQNYDNLDGIQYIIKDNESNIIDKNYFNIKIKEEKKISVDFEIDDKKNKEIYLEIHYKNNSIFRRIKIPLIKETKKILIDASHYNIFTDHMSKFKESLKTNDYEVTFEKDSLKMAEKEYLKNFDLLIFTVPSITFDETRENMRFFYALHHYVYYGGNILLAGYNDRQTKITLPYMNRILKFLYSPIRYRIYHTKQYPIIDYTNNLLKENTPVFYSIEESEDHKSLNKEETEYQKNESKNQYKIFLKNPVEIYAVLNIGEVKIDNLYNYSATLPFIETTEIENRKIYNYKDHTAATIGKFGEGKIYVLSGINFTDFEIDEYDNKKWILKQIEELVK